MSRRYSSWARLRAEALTPAEDEEEDEGGESGKSALGGGREEGAEGRDKLGGRECWGTTGSGEPGRRRESLAVIEIEGQA